MDVSPGPRDVLGARPQQLAGYGDSLRHRGRATEIRAYRFVGQVADKRVNPSWIVFSSEAVWCVLCVFVYGKVKKSHFSSFSDDSSWKKKLTTF